MKKFIYSNYTKFIAAVLFVISVVLGTLGVTIGIEGYCNEKSFIYDLESDFNDVQYLSDLLEDVESEIFIAFRNFNLSEDKNDIGDTIEQSIEKRLNNLRSADKINYYVRYNNTVFTNCGAASENELITSQFYRLVSKNENGNIEIKSNQKRYYTIFDEILSFDKKTPIIACTSIKETYVNECRTIWDRQAAIVRDTFVTLLVCIVVSLFTFVYLLCVCGKTKDGEHKLMWLDNIWTEIHLAFIVGIGGGAAVGYVLLIDEFVSWGYSHNLLNVITTFLAAIASTVVLTSLLSIVRNIKCKRFVESSIIFRVVRWSIKKIFIFSKLVCKKIRKGGRLFWKTLSKKIGALLIGMLLVYTSLIGIFSVGAEHSPLWLALGILLFGFASLVIAFRVRDIEEIRKGISEVRNGNVSYKIPELKCEDMKVLAANFNDIAKGLDESVSAKVKAERLKTELITNVSHDLKTPITSIINYVELLSKIDGLPEEAKDYISVVAKKSERLKNLTQDLFDISKVQSGNEAVVLEKIDVSLLINQSLGENDNEIQKSGLSFCVNASKELYISADGRKMSRVISNLISNILKYTMKNTRVFITACERDSEVIIEFKNIASYPMNFDADEIVGRFVRGDESRTADGNGLGLAIAKSYTEICNGNFEVVIDGDMFKAILKFEKYI